MYYEPLLLPLLIQVFLIFAVWVWMYVARIAEIERKHIDPQDLSSNTSLRGILTDSARMSDNLANQFEMPVLFFLAIVLALILLIQDPVMVAFAWVYVILRVIHAVIHMTYNRVLHRFWVYFASCLALMAIWLRLAWHVL